MIDLFERLPGLLHVIRAAAGAEKRIDGLLDFEVFQALGAIHAVFADVETLVVLSRGKW